MLQRDNILLLKPEPATDEDVARVHSSEYIEKLRLMSDIGEGFVNLPELPSQNRAKTGTPVLNGTYDLAKLSAGGGILAGKAVVEGKVDNAFALIRPPGHHAGKNYGAGFCYFNNAAIVIEYLREMHSLERFMVLDWDVHHGNGTQDIFYDDPTVLCFQTHQAHLYPVYRTKGGANEMGVGEGNGYNINVPLYPETTGESYLYLIRELFNPLTLAFKPEIILVSSGLDMHYSDIFGNIKLHTHTYAEMTKCIMDVAERTCSGKIVMLLEGGYNLEAVPRSIASIIATLANFDDADTTKYYDYKYRRFKKQISEIKKNLSDYWNIF